MRDAVSVLTVGWAGDAIRGSSRAARAPRDPGRQPWRTSSEFYHGSGGLPTAASLDRRCSSAAFELIEETLGPVDIPPLDGDVERVLL
jgi:hypothetical protein